MLPRHPCRFTEGIRAFTEDRKRLARSREQDGSEAEHAPRNSLSHLDRLPARGRRRPAPGTERSGRGGIGPRHGHAAGLRLPDRRLGHHLQLEGAGNPSESPRPLDRDPAGGWPLDRGRVPALRRRRRHGRPRDDLSRLRSLEESLERPLRRRGQQPSLARGSGLARRSGHPPRPAHTGGRNPEDPVLRHHSGDLPLARRPLDRRRQDLGRRRDPHRGPPGGTTGASCARAGRRNRGPDPAGGLRRGQARVAASVRGARTLCRESGDRVARPLLARIRSLAEGVERIQ